MGTTWNPRNDEPDRVGYRISATRGIGQSMSSGAAAGPATEKRFFAFGPAAEAFVVGAAAIGNTRAKGGRHRCR
jgi:hypothetical protein